MTTRIGYQNAELQTAANGRGFYIGLADTNTLRRAELTLHRWAEMECGDENGNAIERDEVTDKPYLTSEWGTQWMTGRRTRRPIPDRERGALRRVAAICERLGIHYFHQTDPRGCVLYISARPMTDSDYNHGVPWSR
jgi:hypothetical protein